jgi:hypothetical protein
VHPETFRVVETDENGLSTTYHQLCEAAFNKMTKLVAIGYRETPTKKQGDYTYELEG